MIIEKLAELELSKKGHGISHYAFKSSSLAKDVLDKLDTMKFEVRQLAPGQLSYPYHWHTESEEMFFILSGEVILRQNDVKHVLASGDLAAFPTGPEGCHQLYNHSKEPVKYLDLWTHHKTDVCYYPDSDKINAGSGEIYRREDRVDYFTGERNIPEFWQWNAVTIDDMREEDLTRISWSGSDTHIKNVAEQLKKVLRGEAEYLVVRQPDGTPVAKGLIDHVYAEDSSEIGQLAVHADLQGKGLGAKLIAAAEARITERGHKWAVMGVEVENDRARKLYERLGYEKYDTARDSWLARDKSGKEVMYHADLILMRKSVNERAKS